MTDSIYKIYENDSAIGIANYIVSLYFRTGLRYKYYPTKLNRLLTIYKLCTLKYTENGLNDVDFVIRDNKIMGMIPGTFSIWHNGWNESIKEDKTYIDDEIEPFDIKISK